MVPVIRRFRNWDDPLDLIRQDWDQWYNQMFPERNWIPGYPVDIREMDGNIEVEAEMPGFKREDIHVDVENDMLHIRAERKEKEKKGKEHLTERRFSRVDRFFRLPSGVDASKVSARLEDGVLFLSLPKVESASMKHIEIK